MWLVVVINAAFHAGNVVLFGLDGLPYFMSSFLALLLLWPLPNNHSGSSSKGSGGGGGSSG
eukprot:CAMPEP_0198324236 /NCGR_PEP_ID=MMETSP1450-20131203/12304_1 /TAXON_ID=753684 ORGANISM="Madagascaria erythrocladiodes, Strain CCMP3234" /NCGR_SAMPLE_ID=MMETSP1450 /ASSEMBLY_ACC=CAM_ASM_001115 /LENGTH=60 /DNA_ID=CAMNT_0044028017 /DNA_START=93 /DNA_END=272 /DNA_ORIENTATION=-